MNKILRTLYIVPLSFLLTGCWTSIFTVAPTPEPVAPVKTVYTTQVTTPKPKTTTVQTVTVTSFNNDWSFYLDLQAVAAAFAESRNAQEFENILNSSKYMINNLDLNHDGWIDYLRVIETRQGYYHVFLIQACLAPSVFQDVATLIAERQTNALYVEVVGDRYLYGYNYVVRPVFVKRPPMWDVFGRAAYEPWHSPYYHGHWPNHYQQPKPVYLNHYQAYVTTYMNNHHYCHHCDYPQKPFYNGYGQMTQTYARHDYQDAHPNDSFDHRVTQTLTKSTPGVTVRNAGELRTETQRQSATSQQGAGVTTRQPTTSTSSSSTTRQPATSQQGAGVTTRQPATSTSSSSTTRQPATSQQGAGVSTRQPATSTSSSSTTRQPATTITRQPSTSVSTRVNASGTTRTTIKTTDANGRTSTVQRTSAVTNTSRQSANSSSTTRQSATSTSSSSTTRQPATSTNGSTTRQPATRR